MHVQSGGQRRVSFPRHKPGGAVVCVAVALVIHGNNVHQHSIASACIQSVKAYSYCWEHSSAKYELHFNYVLLYFIGLSKKKISETLSVC